MNIRQKIIIGFLTFIISLGALASFSFYNLLLLEETTYSVEFIDDISNLILELRRQEKNYLLYGEQDAFDLVMEEARAVLLMLFRRSEFQFDSEQERLSKILEGLLESYQEQLVEIHKADESRKQITEHEIDTLRTIGKDLIDTATGISEVERSRILQIHARLQWNLVLPTLAVASLFTFLFYYINRYILVPLKLIEQTTVEIAEGRYHVLPSRPVKDEIGQVLQAFNTMVKKLRRQQDQLVQAQKLSSIGTLSAGIAHQLNNPLNNISTSAQILQNQGMSNHSELENKMVGNIVKETIRAKNIVRGLLDFARQGEYTPQNFPLREIAETTIQLISNQVPPGLKVTVDIDPEVMVVVDPQRMREALLNLCINAFQAINNDQGKLQLYLDKPEKYSSHVTLVVEDNGCGVEQEALPYIFDPFFTKKGVSEGTGLGLSVTYGIVEECGGEIRVDSTPGIGTKFFIDLPATKSQSMSEES